MDQWKHYLSQFVGSGHCELEDATKVNLSDYDAVWASPPCQLRSSARTQGMPISEFAVNYLDWCLKIESKILWVENVLVQGKHGNEWGQAFNAAQFLKEPIQNRNRIIGGQYKQPHVFHEYKKSFPGICPSILASEYKGSRVDTRRASRFYGRRLTIEECAYHQGFEIPKEWYDIPKDWPYTKGQWQKNLYEAIGNGVPVFMSRSFGEAYGSTEL